MKDKPTDFISIKDHLLLALTLLCFLVCGVRGFPRLPSTFSGEFAISTPQELRALFKQELLPITYFYFAFFPVW